MTELKITRSQAQEAVTRVATLNAVFRQALIENPKAAIEKEFGISLGDVNVKTVVETAGTLYLVVPHVRADGELDDADLERVAGGKDTKSKDLASSLGNQLKSSGIDLTSGQVQGLVDGMASGGQAGMAIAVTIAGVITK
jgi:hypothetical protein